MNLGHLYFDICIFPGPWSLTPGTFFTLVESALQIHPFFLQNEANFRKSQMNVSTILTMEYENKTLGKRGKKQTQTKPIYCGIASMNWVCCVYDSNISFDSAKMALYTGNLEFEKRRQKNLNFLKCKSLNKPGCLRPLTGTLFAYLNRWNFLYTDGTQ